MGYVLQRFLLLLRPWLTLYHRARFGATTLWGASVGLFALGNAIALGLSAYLWSRNAITIGAIFAVFYYINQLNDPIERLRTELEELQRAEAGIQRISELLATHSTLSPGGAIALPVGPLSVQVERVSFAYGAEGEGRRVSADDADGRRGDAGQSTTDSQRTADHERLTTDDQITDSPTNPVTALPAHPATLSVILQDISFHLPAGQVLGLLGRTGSGKSTLARLLLGLYAPQAGRIALGGVDFADTPRCNLPHHVGMVTQEVQIFQGTVRENLTFFDPKIADADVHEVLTLLGLDRWLARLPSGLDTPIGAHGVGLSAGEAQLLAFARVFLKNPGLVILDEASARLDPGTEALLTTAMERLFAGRSAIVIAHRLQTVLHADWILILEQGQIAEYGPREALQADPASQFSRLLRLGLAEVTE